MYQKKNVKIEERENIKELSLACNCSDDDDENDERRERVTSSLSKQSVLVVKEEDIKKMKPNTRAKRFFLLSHPKRNQRKVAKVGNGLSIRFTGEIREEIDGEWRRG